MRPVLAGILMLLTLQRSAHAVDAQDIFHDPADLLYANPQAGSIRLRTKKGTVGQAMLILGTRSFGMHLGYSDREYEYYIVRLNAFDSTLSYRFLVRFGTDSLVHPAEGNFRPTVESIMTPSWAAGKTYYYVNVDGFNNGDTRNDPDEKKDWNTGPEDWTPYGGDLRGIIQKIGYLDSLGPDIIMLSPIFTANSNHKFNPRDYATIDPAFGDTNDLRRLVDAIHAVRKRVVLSIVFSHTGDDFPAFTDIVAKQRASRFIDWYRIQSMDPDERGFTYRAWRSDLRFPLLNLSNQQLQNYLTGFIDYWVRFGFDGLYIGEQDEIDNDFMTRLHNYMQVRYPNILLITSDYRSRREGISDCCFDRAFISTLIDYFVNNEITTAEFDSTINYMYFYVPEQRNQSNLIGLFDYSKRIRSIVDDDLLELMYAFIFTCQCSPILLSGDEMGMRDCAFLNWGSFPWNIGRQDRALWNRIRTLMKIRRENPELTGQHFYTLYIDDIKKVYAYDRGGIIVVLNCNPAQVFVELPAWDGSYVDLINREKYTAYSQILKLSVEPMSYRILKRGI
ncbi:MAG: alpha amylase C-terminal domain-containing protein [candidate division WOR-3 bacterium]|nr:MAG: alpha amylase C-terminal domain-containing protein [candidate division WOR-3 bacterium]